MYARVYPERGVKYDEAYYLITKLFRTDPFFIESNYLKDLYISKPIESNNFCVGLDVEKLSFKVKEKRLLDYGQNYWLIIGIKRVNPDLMVKNEFDNRAIDRIFANFAIKLSKK